MKWQTDELCVACGAWTENGNCFHHLITRRSNPELQNEKFNLIPVCQRCHNMFHVKGVSEMAKRFYSVRVWLEGSGWQIVHGSWTPPVWL